MGACRNLGFRRSGVPMKTPGRKTTRHPMVGVPCVGTAAKPALLRAEALDQVGVRRQVAAEDGTEAFDVVAPVAVQFAADAEPVHQLRAGGGHARPGGVAHHRVEGAGGVGDDEYVKPLLQRREGREGYADIGHHAGDDQLLAGGLDRLDEVLVVPGVDVAGAGDVRGLREHFLEFRHQRAVGAVLEAGGEDGRQVEEPGDVGQCQDVVLELVRAEIADQGEQACLVVDEQHRRIVLVESLVGEGHGVSPVSGGVRRRAV